MQLIALTQYEVRTLDWMSAHGHPCYWAKIGEQQAAFSEISAEAGRYGHACEHTQNALRAINTEIGEIARAATDRYEDWASD